ncbi:hypothetical protein ACROYT_G020880 [Oculina patagonica]
MDSQGKDKQVKQVQPGPILHSVLQHNTHQETSVPRVDYPKPCLSSVECFFWCFCECYDNTEEDCNLLKDHDFCGTRGPLELQYAVLKNCPISCEVNCKPCKDHGSNCSALAKSGQCQDRPQTVVRLCPKTCEACVEDW